MHRSHMCFHIIQRSSMGSFALSIFPGVKLNQYESKKQLWTKNKNPQQTESGDKVPKINPSEQDWLKHRLINVEAAPVLIRYAWETA